MKNIVIIGAGDLGKEVVWLIEDINQREPTYLILGFLDDDDSKTGTEFHGYRILGTTEKLGELGKDQQIWAVVAIQDGRTRRKVVEGCPRFHQWETVVHPTAVIAPSSVVGKGSVFFPQATVSADSSLGDFGLYYIHSTVCNDCRFGDYVSVMTGADVSEHVSVGDEGYLAAGCCVYPHKVLGERVRVAVGATVDRDCGDDAEVSGKNGGFLFFK